MTPQTPERSKQASDGTPYRASSYHSLDSAAPYQHDLKEQLGYELDKATFETDLTAVFKPDGRDVDGVLDLLDGVGLSSKSLFWVKEQWNTPKPLPTTPYPDRARKPWFFTNERASYPAVIWLLNIVVLVYQESRHSHEERHLDGLLFSLYNRQMKEATDTANALKPDGLGLRDRYHSVVHGKISWTDLKLLLILEVKKRWPDLVKQAATYAKCLFAADEGRRFVIVVGFDWFTSTMRFLVFTPSRLASSPACRLSTAAGFKCMVRTMVGILSCPTPTSFGLDETRDGQRFSFNGIVYHSQQLLCRRNCVRGRATCVHALQKVSETVSEKVPSIKKPSRPTAPVPPVCHPGYYKGKEIPPGDRQLQKAPATVPVLAAPIGASRSKRGVSWVSDLAFQRLKLTLTATDESSAPPPPVEPEWDLITPITANRVLQTKRLDNLPHHHVWPDEMVLKDSFPPAGRDCEGDMFAKLRNRFGIPDVITAYRMDDVPSTESFFPEGECTFWDVFNTGEGLPPELLRAIMHGMLGHWVMFNGGLLHRDVSSGNILLLGQPEERWAVKDFGCTQALMECHGIITDGDQAVKWREVDQEVLTQRSGTMPFMSIRLLKAWRNGELALHTAIDDLESFIWVLLWTMLCILQDYGKVDAGDQNQLNTLASTDLMVLVGKRECLPRSSLPRAGKPSAVFDGLLEKWGKIALDASDGVDMLVTGLLDAQEEDAQEKGPAGAEKELFDYSKEKYKLYLEVGLEELGKLDEMKSWADL